MEALGSDVGGFLYGVAAPPPGLRLSACRLARQEIEPEVSTVRLQSHNADSRRNPGVYCFVPSATGKGERTEASEWRPFFAEQNDKSITRIRTFTVHYAL